MKPKSRDATDDIGMNGPGDAAYGDTDGAYTWDGKSQNKGMGTHCHRTVSSYFSILNRIFPTKYMAVCLVKEGP